MNIIVKYILKNMAEKKIRFFLIAVSILLSSSLFFASMAVTGNLVQIYSKQLKVYSGDSDIVITAKEGVRSSWINMDNLSGLEDIMDYMSGVATTGATYLATGKSDQQLLFYGVDYEVLAGYNPVTLSSHLSSVFGNKSLIISKTFAEENNLNIGDSIQVIMDSGNCSYWHVWGVADASGPFMTNGGSRTTMVVPMDTLARLEGYPGEVAGIYAKMSDDSITAKVWVEKLSEKYPNYQFREPLSEEYLYAQFEQISSIFQIMLLLVVFISVYIIFSSYKVMMAERLPVIGTFRSIGATKRKTDMIMMIESVIYGAAGGVFGIGLGMIILKLMTTIMTSSDSSTRDGALVFGPEHVIGTMVFAVMLSLISSAVPIIKASKMPIKEIVLGSFQKKIKNSPMKLILSLGLLIFSVLLPVSGMIRTSMLLNILFMLMSIIALVLLIPYLSEGFIHLFEKIGVLFGNTSSLAVKNLKGNRSIQGNIILLTIGIASLIMINIISYSVSVEVLDIYSSYDFQIQSWINDIDRSNLALVKSVDGVTDVLGIYSLSNVKMVDSDNVLTEVLGVDAEKYWEYFNTALLGEKEAILEALDDGRNIILNRSVTEKFGYEIGDDITLEIKGRNRTYKLIGMTNALDDYGQMAYISDKYFRNDVNVSTYAYLAIRTNQEPETVNERIEERFSDRGIWTRTIVYLRQENIEDNNQLFMILQGFSVMTMVIGIFGVFNNYIVCMLQRKRSLAMFRSVGMSKKQLRQMLYQESIICGLISGVGGVTGGLLLVFMTSYILKAMDMPVTMHMSGTVLIQSFAGGIAVSFIASISPIIRTSNMPIIQAVKYE